MPQDHSRLIAIGILTYNRSFFLKKAIDAFLAQTHENFILIVSDNASTDGTQALCEDYCKKDTRFRYIRQPVNIGAVANATVCLRTVAATADYCLIASDDDLWAPKFLELCLDALLAHQDAVVAFPKFETFYDDGRRNLSDEKLFFPFDVHPYERLKKYILFYSTDGKGILMYGLWRKWAIEKERFIERYEDDVSFVFRGLVRGPFVFVDELLFSKRIPKPSIKNEPLTMARILNSIKNRFEKMRTDLTSMRFLWGISNLTFLEKVRLTGWYLFASTRLFFQRKT